MHYFDSDAYPEQYRGKLYMGNIHGDCINVDKLQRNGSTYLAKPSPIFSRPTMPGSCRSCRKPDRTASLYILDWYDRYHCYQDASADPEGIDRTYGRLYRVRYKDTPRAPKFNLAEESDDQLIERLKSPNVYFRDLAQRLLCERNHRRGTAEVGKASARRFGAAQSADARLVVARSARAAWKTIYI